MEIFSQNLAHFAHGMAFMFFGIYSIRLMKMKNKSRVVRHLLWVMLFWFFIELKDMMYLIDGVYQNAFYGDLNLSVDMWCLPLVMLFMFELVFPKWVNVPRAIALMLPSLLFTAAYIVFRNGQIIKISLIYSNIVGIVLVTIVYLASLRHDKYIKRNYSYIETLDLRWLRKVILLLFICLFIWTFVIWDMTWLGDAFFYTFSVAVWMIIYKYTVVHVSVTADHPGEAGPNPEPVDKNISGDDTGYPFAQALQLSMEDTRLYLNPKLTIGDVASAVGTNRTYLSDYINNTLDTNFYDYVNSYRINRARNILVSEEKDSIEKVAEACGFNSVSTFRRSFAKETGLTPAQYRKKHTGS